MNLNNVNTEFKNQNTSSMQEFPLCGSDAAWKPPSPLSTACDGFQAVTRGSNGSPPLVSPAHKNLGIARS